MKKLNDTSRLPSWFFHACSRNCLPLDHGVPSPGPPPFPLQTLPWTACPCHASIFPQSSFSSLDCTFLPIPGPSGWRKSCSVAKYSKLFSCCSSSSLCPSTCPLPPEVSVSAYHVQEAPSYMDEEERDNQRILCTGTFLSPDSSTPSCPPQSLSSNTEWVSPHQSLPTPH